MTIETEMVFTSISDIYLYTQGTVHIILIWDHINEYTHKLRENQTNRYMCGQSIYEKREAIQIINVQMKCNERVNEVLQKQKTVEKEK